MVRKGTSLKRLQHQYTVFYVIWLNVLYLREWCMDYIKLEWVKDLKQACTKVSN